MRVKVIRKFRDKHTGETHIKGDVLEVTEARYREIQRVGELVYPLPEQRAETPAETLAEMSTELSTEASGDALEEMSIRELREYADKTYKLTFKSGMKKSEIIEILKAREDHGE